MTINIKSIQNLPKSLKRGYFALRSEPEAMEQFRLLMLGTITCLVILYGGISLFIEPKEKALAQKESQRESILAAVPSQYSKDMTPMLQQLIQKKTQLREQIGVLQLQKELLLRQWNLLGDATQFAEIIFTLQPLAGVSIGNNLDQMAVADTRSYDLYELYPVTLSGSADFKKLLDYLQYIERHSEVGLLDNLVMETLPHPDEATPATVHFSLMVGRINVKQTL
jgi:hypothetical protein